MKQFDTTVGAILSTGTPTTNEIMETLGYTTKGDGGGAQWKHNSVTGQTASQSPSDLGDALLNDASGNQWALVSSQSFNLASLGAQPGNDITLIFDAAVASDRAVQITIPGIYTTSGSAYTSINNFYLLQSGGVTLKLADTSDASLMQFTSSNKITIEGGSIDGNRLNQTSPTSTSNNDYAIYFELCDEVTVKDIDIADSLAGAVRSRNTQRTNLTNVLGSGAGYIPFYVGPSSSGGVAVGEVSIKGCVYDWSGVDRLISERALCSVTSGDPTKLITDISINENIFTQSNDSPSDFHSCINVRGGINVNTDANHCYNAGLPITIVSDCLRLSCSSNIIETSTTFYAIEVAGAMQEYVVLGNLVNGSSAETGIQINGGSSKGIVSSNQISGVNTGVKVVGGSNLIRTTNITFSNNNIDCAEKAYDLKWATGFSIAGGDIISNDTTSIINLESCTSGSVSSLNVIDYTGTFFIRVSGTETVLEDFHVSGNNIPVLSAIDRYIRDTTSGAGVGTNITYKANSNGPNFIDYTNNILEFTDSGTPESNVTAGIGSRYYRTDGGAGTSFYIKESGTGNTGWIAK